MIAVSGSLYAEGYYDYFSHEAEFHEQAPQTEAIDISHDIIQSTYSTKYHKQKAASDSKSDFSSLIIMNSEKSNIEKNNVDITSSAFKLNYDKDFTNSSDIGAIFSYRNSKNDGTDLTSQEFQLSPYYKYYKDISENVDIETIGNLILGTRNFSGGTVDYDAYQTYGAGVTVIPGYYIGDTIMLNAPIGLQSIKRSSASGNDDLQTFANYGVGADYKIKDNWSVNANVLRTQDTDSDNNTEATYYVLQTTYYGEYWNFGAGYKTVRNVDNYDENTFMISVQYNWQ